MPVAPCSFSALKTRRSTTLPNTSSPRPIGEQDTGRKPSGSLGALYRQEEETGSVKTERPTRWDHAELFRATAPRLWSAIQAWLRLDERFDHPRTAGHVVRTEAR